MPFDKSKFIEQYKAETREHVENLNLGLLKLEKNPADKDLLNNLMREAHTIKGSSTMMGYKRIAEIAHKVEDGFEKAIAEGALLDTSHYNVLFRALDAIIELLEDKVTWEDKGVARPFVEELCARIDSVFSGKRPRENAAEEARAAWNAGPGPSDKGRPEGQEAVRIPAGYEPLHAPEASIRVDTARLDKLMNLSGEQVISKIRLGELVKALSEKAEASEETESLFGPVLNELRALNNNIDFLSSSIQSEVMNIRMVPVSLLFNTFPRAMRSLALAKGKKVDFELKGTETELDKSIIDQLKDPIMHMLRNAVDHGVEAPAGRKAAGKPEEGRIVLSAYQQGSQVVIEVSDDGSGVDVSRVRELVVSKGLSTKSRIAEMADEQVMQFVFSPGFSTKEEVSDTSGRGVGLDVVRDTVSKLKGMVEIESKAGLGSRFIMRVPLTLAITGSLLVAAGDDIFAIPVERIVETVRVDPDDIKSVETKEAITVRGRILPLVRIMDLFALPRKGIFEKSSLPVVIVQAVEKRIGLLADKIIGHQQIVGKAIGDPLSKVKNIAGATILGSGRVVLMLDIPSIIDSAEGVVIKKASVDQRHVVTGKRKKTILLAEDSMSTAMLEKNILESVGYSVVIAKDGLEALERASQEKFDLVISDVLMPRMDGFELTARLKKDKDHRDIPVIIVTTRESDADKRRGLDAGADAYLLKSEFTSDILLDTIERLVG